MKLSAASIKGVLKTRQMQILVLLCIAFVAAVSYRLLYPAMAYPSVDLEDAWIVSRVGTQGAATTAPKFPVEGEDTYLYLVVRAREQGRTVYYTDAADVIINGEAIASSSIRKWDDSAMGSPTIRWYKVEPTENNLSNTKGGWHWERVPLTETLFHRGDWQVRADVNPTVLKTRSGKGTMRYKVEFRLGFHAVASPGRESYGPTGINDDVLRISVRGATGVDIVDWAYSFMNLPYIWGSETPTGRQEDHQSERYIGADCADYVVAAARKAGHPLVYGGSHNLSPSDARRYTKYVSRDPELLDDGFYYEDGHRVKIGEGGVRPGDIVLFTRRHVGILARDLPPVGYLTADDTILHAFFKEPAEEPISRAYHSGFSIVRLVK